MKVVFLNADKTVEVDDVQLPSSGEKPPPLVRRGKHYGPVVPFAGSDGDEEIWVVIYCEFRKPLLIDLPGASDD